jgi:hypothetical protein
MICFFRCNWPIRSTNQRAVLSSSCSSSSCAHDEDRNISLGYKTNITRELGFFYVRFWILTTCSFVDARWWWCMIYSCRSIVWHQGKFNGGNLQPPGALLQQHDPAAESRRLEAIFYTVYKSCTFTISPSSGYVPITRAHARFPHIELPSEQLLDAVCSLRTVLDGIVSFAGS